MLKKIRLTYHTMRYLRWRQIWYRLPILKNIGRKISQEKLDLKKAGQVSDWVPSISCRQFYDPSKSFTFLNRFHSFTEEIDWDFKDYGLLWSYNLNYFEFLTQENLSTKEALYLMADYQQNYSTLKTGHDPYPLSLRLIFWIRFFCKINQVPEENKLLFLHQQAKELQSKLEYHILGNHLLENAFALFISGSFLRDISIYNMGKKILLEQLNEQILPDGGHFELSPMYHHLILYRLMDSININRSTLRDKKVLSILEIYASKMLGWMQQMTFKSGSFPLFNDSANKIAPSPKELLDYADRLSINVIEVKLKESGYRKWQGPNWEMFIDIGDVGPLYLPGGHAHNDIFSFCLSINQIPYIIDTGVSTYQENPIRRNIERSTFSHNTVQIGQLEQNQIWDVFRMAKRAKVFHIKETSNVIKSAHDGFFFKGKPSHERTFERKNNQIIVKDKVFTKNHEAKFSIHLSSSSIRELHIKNGIIHLDIAKLQFTNYLNIELQDYEYSEEFGKHQRSKCIIVSFMEELETKIFIN